MQRFGQKATKQTLFAYLGKLVRFCQQRHSTHTIKGYSPIVLSVSAMVSKYWRNFFPDITLPNVDELIQSADRVFAKLVKITSYLNVTGYKNFTTIPKAATKGFLELVSDFCCKYTAWAAPDKERHVREMTRIILGLQKAYGSPTVDQVVLGRISTGIINLRTKLNLILSPDELAVFNNTLVVAIKATITNLHTSLCTTLVDPSHETVDSVLICGAMERQTQWLLGLTNQGVVDELNNYLDVTFPRNDIVSPVDGIRYNPPMENHLIQTIRMR